MNMPTRRRFFPMQPVQTVPGQTVEMAVMLHPQGQAAAPAPGPAPACDILGISWVGSLIVDIAAVQSDPYSSIVGVEALDGGRWRYTFEYAYEQEALFTGVPSRFDQQGRPLAMPAPGWGCHELLLDGGSYGEPLTGILYGRSMSSVQWDLSWDLPWDGVFEHRSPFANPSADPDGVYSISGHVARQVGNIILVEFAVRLGGSYELTETLTATASCAGNPVGTLVAHLKRSAY